MRAEMALERLASCRSPLYRKEQNGIDTPARKVELNHSVAKQLQV